MIRYHKKGTCDCCGIYESLDADHSIGNHSDSSHSNCQTLCKHCYMQKGKMGLPLFDYIKNLCRADLRMKATMQQSSQQWFRKTKGYRRKPKYDSSNLTISISEYEPYTDHEFRLIISAFIRGNPGIYNE